MKLLVFGRSGQVATELRRLAGDNLEVVALGRGEADLADPVSCLDALSGIDTDVVINAAAYTAVDMAEEEEALATCINAEAPSAIARQCAVRGLPFIHLSTDYVFAGDRPGGRSEDDRTVPLNAYGRSKLAGEEAVRGAGGEAAILRTSWVFSAHGRNFVTTMLRLGADRNRLTVVDDQRGGPTAAADIAMAVVAMARRFAAGNGVPGTFHFTGTPVTTWCGFARAIFTRARLEAPPEVIPVTSEKWPTAARRPENSELDCTRIAEVYAIERPDWRHSLARVLHELEHEHR